MSNIGVWIGAIGVAISVAAGVWYFLTKDESGDPYDIEWEYNYEEGPSEPIYNDDDDAEC